MRIRKTDPYLDFFKNDEIPPDLGDPYEPIPQEQLDEMKAVASSENPQTPSFWDSFRHYSGIGPIADSKFVQSLGRTIGSGIDFGKNLVTHPINTLGEIVESPFKSALTGVDRIVGMQAGVPPGVSPEAAPYMNYQPYSPDISEGIGAGLQVGLPVAAPGSEIMAHPGEKLAHGDIQEGAGELTGLGLIGAALHRAGSGLGKATGLNKFNIGENLSSPGNVEAALDVPAKVLGEPGTSNILSHGRYLRPGESEPVNPVLSEREDGPFAARDKSVLENESLQDLHDVTRRLEDLTKRAEETYDPESAGKSNVGSVSFDPSIRAENLGGDVRINYEALAKESSSPEEFLQNIYNTVAHEGRHGENMRPHGYALVDQAANRVMRSEVPRESDIELGQTKFPEGENPADSITEPYQSIEGEYVKEPTEADFAFRTAHESIKNATKGDAYDMIRSYLENPNDKATLENAYNILRGESGPRTDYRESIPEENLQKVTAYHGTRGDFDKLDVDQTEFGPHFGTLEQAERRALSQRWKPNKENPNDSDLEIFSPEGSNIRKAELDLQNPLRTRDLGIFSGDSVLGDLYDKGLIKDSEYSFYRDEMNKAGKRAYENVKDEGGTDYLKNAFSAEAKARSAYVRNLLKEKGYDSIVYKNNYEDPNAGADSYIVFDPKTQTKSPYSGEHLSKSFPTFEGQRVEILGRKGNSVKIRMSDGKEKIVGFSRLEKGTVKPETTTSPEAKGQYEDLTKELEALEKELNGNPEENVNLPEEDSSVPTISPEDVSIVLPDKNILPEYGSPVKPGRPGKQGPIRPIPPKTPNVPPPGGGNGGPSEPTSSGKPKGAFNWALDLWRAPSAIKASLDIPALSHSLMDTLAHPIRSVGEIGRAAKGAFSEKFYNEKMDEIQSRKTYEDSVKAGLKYPHQGFDPGAQSFGSFTAEQIPGVKQSERAQNLLLSEKRARIFDSLTEAIGESYDENPKAWEQAADLANSATGYGSFKNKGVEGTIKALNQVFWSARLQAARIKHLGLIAKSVMPGTDMPAPIRQEAWRQAGTTIALGFGLLKLSQSLGADVNDDPRSSNFAKAIWTQPDGKKVVWSPFGSYQPPVRFLVQQLTGTKVTDEGKVYDLANPKGPYAPTRASELGAYAKNRMNPSARTAWDLYNNNQDIPRSSFVDQDNPMSIPLGAVEPINAGALKDLYDELGPVGPAVAGLPMTLGANIDVYKNNQKKKRKGKVLSSF